MGIVYCCVFTMMVNGKKCFCISKQKVDYGVWGLFVWFLLNHYYLVNLVRFCGNQRYLLSKNFDLAYVFLMLYIIDLLEFPSFNKTLLYKWNFHIKIPQGWSNFNCKSYMMCLHLELADICYSRLVVIIKVATSIQFWLTISAVCDCSTDDS